MHGPTGSFLANLTSFSPQYAGWFVRFKHYQGQQSNNSYAVPACDWYGNATHPPKCSGFYHDQTQTPEHPGANTVRALRGI